MAVTLRHATDADAPLVGELAFRLVSEIAPEAADRISLETYRATAATLLDGTHSFWALIAGDDEGRPQGLLTLNECASIYAGGRFGEIAELYVDPAQRSAGVAAELVSAAIAFGRDRGWSRLEVGAPDVPRWRRTVDFYRKEGFVEVGPRLKCLL